jgi:hypothetical protein
VVAAFANCIGRRLLQIPCYSSTVYTRGSSLDLTFKQSSLVASAVPLVGIFWAT